MKTILVLVTLVVMIGMMGTVIAASVGEETMNSASTEVCSTGIGEEVINSASVNMHSAGIGDDCSPDSVSPGIGEQ